MKQKNIAKQVLLALVALNTVGSAQASEEFTEIMTSYDSRYTTAEYLKSPESAPIHASFGDDSVTRLNPKAAIREYTQAITLDRSFARINSKEENYFLSYGLNGQNSEVMENLLDRYNKLLQKAPTDPYALAVRGEIKFVLNDAEGAEADFKNSLRYDPHLYFSNLRLTEVGLFLQSSSSENSITYCKQAVARFPKDARMHCNLGLAFKANGEIEKAVAEYDKAIALAPRFSRTYLNRAVAEAETNNRIAEFSDISQCLSLEPDLRVAKEFRISEQERYQFSAGMRYKHYEWTSAARHHNRSQPKQERNWLISILISALVLMSLLVPRQMRKHLLFHQQ